MTSLLHDIVARLPNIAAILVGGALIAMGINTFERHVGKFTGSQPVKGLLTRGKEWRWTMARHLVLALGRLTFAVMNFFKRLGVDMTTVDEALAAWTNYTQELKDRAAELTGQLEAAEAQIQELIEAEGARDQERTEQLTREIAEKIHAALEAARNPVEPPPEVLVPPDELEEGEPEEGEGEEPEEELHEEPEG